MKLIFKRKKSLKRFILLCSKLLFAPHSGSTQNTNAWSDTLGANFGKVVLFEKQQLKFIAGGGYFVAKPDNGPNWQIFAQAVFLFP